MRAVRFSILCHGFVIGTNTDPSIDMSSLAISVNSVATMLKTFFNDLAEPLVPRYLHAELMEAEGEVTCQLRCFGGISFVVIVSFLCH